MADRLALRLKQYTGRGHPKKATFAEAAAAYLAQGKHSDANVKCTNRIKTIIGEAILCEDVDWSMVSSVAHKMLRPTSSQQTLKRQVASPMKAVMTWAAVHWGEKRCCPIPKFPEIPDAAPRAILVLPGQAKAMHDAAVASGDLLVADLIAIGLGEGPRRGELYELTWEFVDMEREIITLRETKGLRHEERERTISDPRPRTITALRGIAMRTGKRAGPVFLRPDCTPFASAEEFGNAVNPILKLLAKECGHPDADRVTLHVLRHSAATWHYILKKDLLEVQWRFDWSDGKSAKRYVKKASQQLRPEINSFLGLPQD